jgi:dipeptidyl aminopeptidase/acylaminoacyl peptidase
MDIANMKTLKKVYNNEIYDVSGISRSRKRDYEVDYYYYTGEKQEIIPVSAHYKALHAKFEEQFGDKQFSISSKTENEDKYLIYVTSDKLYGKYFLYDVDKNSFKEIIDMMPQLKEEDMAEMRPIVYKTRDGLTVY